MSNIGHLPAPVADEKNQISGTHGGKLEQEARDRRKAKNARNASRRGQETRPRGSNKKSNPSGHGKR